MAVAPFLLRLARLVPLPGRNRERRIRVRGGIELNYRLNRGDMQSIREVWMDECYRLPFELAPGRLIDLGANIGLTSLWFAHREDSNRGHVGSGGRVVSVVSMDTLLRKLPPGVDVDLVKIDIEGGEGPLLQENLGWLGRVKSLIAEFHPQIIDYAAAIRSIESQGFRYIPGHSASDFDSIDAFIRIT
jgi:hypothetical protein